MDLRRSMSVYNSLLQCTLSNETDDITPNFLEKKVGYALRCDLLSREANILGIINIIYTNDTSNNIFPNLLIPSCQLSLYTNVLKMYLKNSRKNLLFKIALFV